MITTMYLLSDRAYRSLKKRQVFVLFMHRWRTKRLLMMCFAKILTVGRRIKHGGIVVYESTVYPGATEEVCVPVIENTSGLRDNGGVVADVKGVLDRYSVPNGIHLWRL